MIHKVLLCCVCVLSGVSYCFGQSTFIPLNDDSYHLIDRLEIKRGKFTEGFHSNVKPFEREAVVALTDSILTEETTNLTSVDRATIGYLRQDSWEWLTSEPSMPDSVAALSRLGSISTDAPVRKRTFFEHPSDLYSLQTEDVDLHVNFASDNYYGAETNTAKNMWFTARGVEIRGIINQKLGFYTFVADNQGIFPRYVRNYVGQYNTPGEGLTKATGRFGLDFLSARGYITFRPLKNIAVQFGHDRNFIGSGYRSMLLSDISSPYLFLKITTQLGKFQYTNLWSSMINFQTPGGGYSRYKTKKYTAMHHLSLNLSDRFNIGIFEAEVFGPDSTHTGFDLNYLNPIIFYRFVESYLGSQDNALLGMDFRWLLAKRMSVYGQFMMDEFLTKYYFSNRGSWTKKYATQIGAKYVDAFGVPNLDLQAEYNMARPYTYSHRDGTRNYTHWRQPLAHPLGANFTEFLTIIRYKPIPRLTAYGTMMWTNKGLDFDEKNWGGNILLDYETRVDDFGNFLTQGTPQFTRLTDLRLSYMLTHNLFLDGRLMWRREEIPQYGFVRKTRLHTIALRYNIPYRQQIF
ncbi:hypothetical protein GCM10007390_50490 [Persicitalea jodogahamensis]|uniref:Capsule assembly Wzi family protein n=2 Tax=Persicitalea jodogahamensis TaxID=402147 RepID=A0A8J3D649_9BACT|nr:hypothetical protein GCM10007390_50490 [Persicitalea jodogahamensis]